MSDEFVARDFVYCGRRWSVKNTMLFSIRMVEPDGTLGPESVYPYTRTDNRAIGAIYTGASFNSNTARGLERAKWSGRWEDDALRLAWTVKDGAAVGEQKHKKFETEQKGSEIEQIMLPLRKLYDSYRDKYDPHSQILLEQAVVRALKTKVRKDEK